MLDDMVIMGLYPLFSHKHKELRFAILLPFSVLFDAENGRLSATLICHAPAPFGHTQTGLFLQPHPGHKNVGTYILCFPRAHQMLHHRSLHCTLMGAPKMASFSTPAAAGVWLVPSRHGYKCTFPSYQSSNFLCPFSIATITSNLLSLTFLSCHLLASRPLVHLKFTGSPLTQSAQISEHAPMEMIQCQQPQDYKQILLYLLTNTNDDRPFEPNSSEMDVTKPECPPPMA